MQNCWVFLMFLIVTGLHLNSVFPHLRICAINNKTKLNKGASNQPKSDKNTCKHFFDVHEFKAFWCSLAIWFYVFALNRELIKFLQNKLITVFIYFLLSLMKLKIIMLKWIIRKLLNLCEIRRLEKNLCVILSNQHKNTQTEIVSISFDRSSLS